MTVWTLPNDYLSHPNLYPGTYGDLAPAAAVAGDTFICGDDEVTGSGYLAGDFGQGLYAVGMTVVGGDDTLNGSTGNDILNGGGGNDVLNGGAGFDYAEYIEAYNVVPDGARVIVDLSVGSSWSDYYGNDTLNGIEGVMGSLGNDWIAGSTADNDLGGGDGDDVIFGRAGNDYVEGNMGNDALYGDAGDDVLVDFAGQNWMSGGDGNDYLNMFGGNPGEWTAMHGDDGNDIIDGSSRGSSLGLYGDAGNDTIRFGEGIAYIQGGAGADVIMPSVHAFTDPASFAQVFDFEDGIDKIGLAAISGATTANVDIRNWGSNTGIVINDGQGHTTTLMLMGVTSDKITFGNDFVLI